MWSGAVSLVQSKTGLALLAFVAACCFFGLGFLASLCVAFGLFVVAGIVYPFSLADNEIEVMANDLVQSLLWLMNHVGEKYVHAALYLLDVDLAIALAAAAVCLGHL